MAFSVHPTWLVLRARYAGANHIKSLLLNLLIHNALCLADSALEARNNLVVGQLREAKDILATWSKMCDVHSVAGNGRISLGGSWTLLVCVVVMLLIFGIVDGELVKCKTLG